MLNHYKILLVLLLSLSLEGCSNEKSNTIDDKRIEVSTCLEKLSAEFKQCTKTLNDEMLACHEHSGEECESNNATILGSLDQLGQAILQHCSDSSDIQLMGYPASFDQNQLTTQLQHQCVDGAQALSRHVFGGPKGKVLDEVTGQEDRTCLTSAYAAAYEYMSNRSVLQSQCIKGVGCDALDSNIANIKNQAINTIEQVCSSQPIESFIGETAQQLIESREFQSDCSTSYIYPDQDEIKLTCEPRKTVSATQAYTLGPNKTEKLFSHINQQGETTRIEQYIPNYGEYVQIELDGDEFGTRCGDGSNYRFWMQLAPNASQLNDVYVYVQGGGSCMTESTCNAAAYKLNNRRLDGLGETPSVHFSDSYNTENPFKEWTKVMLPYCTQDGHIGSGLEEQLGSLSLHRNGSVNLRKALAYARDVIRQKKMEAGNEYINDDLNVVLHGSSAGGVGVQFNYHYLLDELQLSNSAAVVNTGLRLNNTDNTEFMQANLAQVETWGYKQVAPSYCISDDCINGDTIAVAHAERLDSSSAPLQHLLWVTYQYDTTQSEGGGFNTTADWSNKLRDVYCEIKDANNLAFWMALPSNTSSHVVPEQASSNGVTFTEWLNDFVLTGLASDEVETFTPQGYGVLPFNCQVNNS